MKYSKLCQNYPGGGQNCQNITIGIVLVICAVLLSVDLYANTMVLPVFSLLPFYYFGYIVDWERLRNQIAKLPWWLTILLFLIYLGISYIVPYETILFRINIWQMDITITMAILSKFVYYVAALLGSIIVIRIVTGKVIKYVTDKSANGMIIYIGSSFVSPYLYILLYNKLEVLQSGTAVNIVSIIVFTLVSIAVLSWNCWKKLYDFIFGRFVA